MTAFVVLRDLELSDEVTTPEYPAAAGESLMGLRAGEVVTVRDLLYGLLIASGNDAAAALALRVSGSIPDFVAEMNRTAQRLGLSETAYADPIGLDGGHANSGTSSGNHGGNGGGSFCESAGDGAACDDGRGGPTRGAS